MKNINITNADIVKGMSDEMKHNLANHCVLNKDDYFAYERYFHLRDARIMGMFIYEFQKENKKYKEAIDKAIEFTNKKWGTWCTHHLEYMTELQNILKEVDL